jgi:small subunit ribosomal protein S9
VPTKTRAPSVGKRKIAVAKATIRAGKGIVRINSKLLDLWGPKYLVERIKEPLGIAGEIAGKVDIDVTVRSSGVSSQADAVRTAVAKALAGFGGEKLKKAFMDYDRTLMVSDVRQNEPWKPGASSPRSSAQKSKR